MISGEIFSVKSRFFLYWTNVYGVNQRSTVLYYVVPTTTGMFAVGGRGRGRENNCLRYKWKENTATVVLFLVPIVTNKKDFFFLALRDIG